MVRDGPHWEKELAEFARRMEGHGIGFGYHNHNWELQPKAGGQPRSNSLFAAAAGSPLNWQVVAWLVRGGGDAKALTRGTARWWCRRM